MAVLLANEIKLLENYFTSMELRNNIECISRSLFFRESRDDNKIKYISETFHEVTVSPYAYDNIIIYLNKNAERSDFCRENI